MASPFVSIIIPTCDRTDDLSVCVGSLVRQLPGDGLVEILVCDDGKGVETREMLSKKFPEAVWHQGPRVGPAGNRNLGARNARGQWLIFIDDDCFPRPALLSTYLGCMKEHHPRQTILEGATYCPKGLPSLLWESPLNTDGGKLPSCNFAIERSLFFELGCFDERYFPAFEDMEFFARSQARGIPLHFLRDAAVDHGPRLIPSPEKLARRWEVRVIYAYDLGATPGEVLWRLPVHVAKVIISRFRRWEWRWENIEASCYFAAEFILVLWHLPGWLRKHWTGDRSRFWREQLSGGKAHAKYGF